MRRTRTSSIAGILMACVACAGDMGEDTGGLVPGAWTVDSVPVLSVGGHPDLQFFGVADLEVLESGAIAVADGGTRLRVLDPAGSVRATFGRAGEGPGELLSIGWIDELAGDSLLVYDEGRHRVLIFTAAGEFQREIAVQPMAAGEVPPVLVGLFADLSFLGYRQLPAASPVDNSGIVRPQRMLLRVGQDGAIQDSLDVVSGDEVGVIQGVIIEVPFKRVTLLAVGEDEFYVAPTETFRIVAMDWAGDLRREMSRPVEIAPIAPEDLGDAATIRGIPRPYPPTFPAISRIVLDSTAFLWVGSFNRSTVDPMPWVVFAPDGQLVAETQMPAGFTPFDIAGDIAAGVWTDEVEVEHIRVHRIDRP